MQKALSSVIYCTYDTYSECQGNEPAKWIDSLSADLQTLCRIDPKSAAPFISHEHLGENAAKQLASWRTKQRTITWTSFREAFLTRFIGKAPTVTRASWKKLSMHSCGGYHEFLTEFSRQKALISTGPDEVIEVFLTSLNSNLRSQVEFNEHRRWKPDEIDKLVHITTERVNKSVSSLTQTMPGHAEKQTRQNSNSGRRKRFRSAGDAEDAARPAQWAKRKPPGQSNKTFIGRTPQETVAVSEYRISKQQCKFCCTIDHKHQTCRRRDNPVPYNSQRDRVDVHYWLNKSQTKSQGYAGPSSKN